MITIKTFAQVREVTGEDTVSMELPAGCNTVAGLKRHLQTRSGSWQQALSDGVLCAVNKQLGDDTSPINNNDEVAFFPPVTGG